MGMGFRAVVNSYTELKKTVGLYEGIRQILGSIENDPVYNTKRIFNFSEEESKKTI